MEPVQQPQPRWIPISLAVLYFLTAWGSYQQRLFTGLPPMFWPAHGIILGTFLIFGIRNWPYFLISSLILNFTRGFSWVTAPLLTLGHMVGPILGTHLFHRYAGRRAHLNSQRNVVLFFTLVLGAGCFTGVCIETLAVTIRQNNSASFFSIWFDWWLDECLGSLIIVPVWLALVYDRAHVKKQLSGWHLQAPPLFLACIFIAVCIYTPLNQQITATLIRPYLLYPFILWAAIRFGIVGASLVIQLTAVCVIAGLLMGSFPQPALGGPLLGQVLLHECVLTVLGATGLVIAATLREKEEALETRDTFLSIASHELKTPLTSLKLQTELTRRYFSAASSLEPGRTQKFLDQSEKQIKRITSLVEDMLDTSRIDTGKLTLRPERFDLRVLIQELLPRLAPVMEAAGCEVQFEGGEIIFGNWDRFRLEQVITNLLTNAARYGGGKPVEIRAGVEGPFAVMSVRDHGRGIAKADQDRIFHRFERITPNEVSGLGIGLFIVKQVVGLHGGTVLVKSEPGEGSEFTIRLPLG